MSAPVYSVNLGLGQVPAGYWDFLVPQDPDTLVLRDLELWNSSTQPLSLTLYLASGDLSAVWFYRVLEPNEWFQWQGRLVVIPTNKIISSCTTGAVIHFVSSGYRLSP